MEKPSESEVNEENEGSQPTIKNMGGSGGAKPSMLDRLFAPLAAFVAWYSHATPDEKRSVRLAYGTAFLVVQLFIFLVWFPATWKAYVVPERDATIVKLVTACEGTPDNMTGRLLTCVNASGFHQGLTLAELAEQLKVRGDDS